MSRKLTYEKIATTEDTDDPVINAKLEDTGSWMNIIVDSEDEIIRVAHVVSKRKGDMSTILDDVVQQLELDHVQFVHPLDDMLGREPGERLLDKLHGFEERTLDISDHERPVDQIDVYEGTWQL